MHGCKSFLKALMLVGVVAFVSSAVAETKTWVGKTQQNTGMWHASRDANWSPSGAPKDGDDIVFDATSAAGNNCYWDLDITPASWTQTSDFTKTVTFRTEFEEYDGTAPKFVEITGDVALNGGKWTHVGLPNNSVLRRYRLYVKVGGAMTIGESGVITATSLGYTLPWSCVTGEKAVLKAAAAGAYAGCGGWLNDADDPLTTGLLPYGSAIAPEDPGNAGSSGAYGKGGGSIRLDVAGKLTVDGQILSDASASMAGGTGGSIYVRAGSICGSGKMSADSKVTGTDYQISTQSSAAGGGRIAVVLTGDGADFTDFDPLTQLSAKCYCPARETVYASPGTVYVETRADTPNEGRLIISGPNSNPHGHLACYGSSVAGYNGGTVRFSRISLLNGAKALVPPGVTLDIRGTVFDGADSTKSAQGIHLLGGTLIAPDDWAYEHEVVSAGGIVQAGSVTFAAGSALKTDIGSGVTFTGDVVLSDGATATLDAETSVEGDLTIGGTVTRTGGLSVPLPLELSVGGDLTIAASGVIDVTGKGYNKLACPPGQTMTKKLFGIYGGMGYQGTGASISYDTVLPYGSIRDPQEAGSGGNSVAGGGIVLLTVGGTLTNDGAVRADGSSQTSYPGGGGAVNVRAGALAGRGFFSADGGLSTAANEQVTAGGGRVAIRLTGEGEDFSAFTGKISAYGGHKQSGTSVHVGGAGTVWLQTAGQADDEGSLIVANALSTYQGWGKTPVGGAFMAADELAFGDVIIGNAARLVLEPDKEMSVSGDFSNAGDFLAQAGSTVRFVGAETSCISGNVAFVNVACEVEGKKLEVADGSVIKITGECGIVGSTEEPIMMYSPAGTTWTLDNSESSIVLENVALSNCQATAALTVKNGVDLGGNSANISFITISGAELLTWTGEADSDWSNPDNWDRGRLPLAADQVVIPATAAQMPVMGVDITVSELAVSNGASLNFGSQTLTVNGPATIAGSLATAEGAVLKVTGDCAITGTVVPDTLSVRLLGEAEQTFVANAQTFAAVTALAPMTAFVGDFTAGALTVGDGMAAFAATFAAGAKVTTFDLTVKGMSSETCSLACATTDGTWELAASLAHVSAVTVSGSDASSGFPVYPADDCADGSGNVNWKFDESVVHWNGTAWAPAEPTAETVAWIDAGTTRNATEGLSAKGLVVDRGATLSVKAALTVASEAVVVAGTLELNVPSAIGGDLVFLPDGKLTHAQNVNTEDYKIDLTVGGDVRIPRGASIDVTGKGYSGGKDSGPGATPSAAAALSKQVSASYGGRGYTGSYAGGNVTPATEYSAPCYGSILCPTNCGSCGFYYQWSFSGGGAVKLTCAGTLTVDGEIVADGKKSSSACGSGGSVWLTVGALTGAGSIRADGGWAGDQRYAAGGGGRVAVYLKNADATFDDFGQENIRAFGGVYGSSGDSARGSAGTVYLQTAAEPFGEGVLKVVNKSSVFYRKDDDATDLPGGLYSIPNETRNLRVEAKSYGTVSLTGDVTIRDISLLDKTAHLKLNGHTLTVRSFRHAVSPDDTKQIDYGEGGKIDWLTPGLMILVR